MVKIRQLQQTDISSGIKEVFENRQDAQDYNAGYYSVKKKSQVPGWQADPEMLDKDQDYYLQEGVNNPRADNRAALARSQDQEAGYCAAA
jgi:hypothetical protein